ncbi:DNA-damage-inducible protein J [Variovorax sp. OV329]|nr:type II toxin-antitoxin system RelB/DinJ family antitoxin [Variovorax sp. OV329]SFM89619.1 DNA-damage-inducible protein J [Variovorax sp. OV329]
MLHVRVDDDLKEEATATLANVGLSVSEAIRIFLTRVTKEGGLPAGLAVDTEAHDRWFHAKVREALEDTRPTVPHDKVMADARALIRKKRRAQS